MSSQVYFKALKILEIVLEIDSYFLNSIHFQTLLLLIKCFWRVTKKKKKKRSKTAEVSGKEGAAGSESLSKGMGASKPNNAELLQIPIPE